MKMFILIAHDLEFVKLVSSFKFFVGGGGFFQNRKDILTLLVLASNGLN